MVNIKTKPKIVENYNLFVIPSWGQLLGYPTLGKYSNHNVSKISQDLVIFFGGAECSVQTEMGSVYYLFGLGYYYTKFELQSGRYITDNRQLTGLILSDFVYDYLATSKNVTLEDDRDVIVSENLFKLPIDLSFKSENKRTFIQGTLMRNLFIPFKDVFLEFMDTLKNPKVFRIDKTGPILLSTHWESFNQLLLSSEMDDEMKESYLSPTAGLHGVAYDSKQHLEQFYSRKDLKFIEDVILYLKMVYSAIDYDPMYLFSILVNASIKLRSRKISPTFKKNKKSKYKLPKESVFLSAEARMDSFVDWPEMFKRKTKAELEGSVVHEESKLYQPKEDEKEISNVPVFREEQKEFKIRTMKRPKVFAKPLPIIPTSNTLDILLVIREIVYQDYDIRSIARALETGRDYIKTMILHSNILWEMSKFANLYRDVEPNLGLSSKEKSELIEQIERWINLMNKKQSS
jgi:hypothetical protein